MDVSILVFVWTEGRDNINVQESKKCFLLHPVYEIYILKDFKNATLTSMYISSSRPTISNHWYWNGQVWSFWIVFSVIRQYLRSWNYGTYHIGDLRRLRRACVFAQSHQSLHCSHTWSMEVDERSDKTLDIWPHWMAAHSRLKNEFTEDENLISWLILLTSYQVHSLKSILHNIRNNKHECLWKSSPGLYLMPKSKHFGWCLP